MFSKLIELKKATQIVGGLVQLTRQNSSAPTVKRNFWRQEGEKLLNGTVPGWSQVSTMSTNKKCVPCPCVRKKIRICKKKKYERCDKKPVCGIKHKCKTDKCGIPPDKNQPCSD